jgi:hypothetical protein
MSAFHGDSYPDIAAKLPLGRQLSVRNQQQTTVEESFAEEIIMNNGKIALQIRLKFKLLNGSVSPEHAVVHSNDIRHIEEHPFEKLDQTSVK